MLSVFVRRSIMHYEDVKFLPFTPLFQWPTRVNEPRMERIYNCEIRYQEAGKEDSERIE